jgi:hypothetical protein
MDEQLSLDTAAAAAPALRALATEILQAGAAHLGVSLDAAGVLLRRGGGVPAVHVAAAADQLLGHLAAIEGPPCRTRASPRSSRVPGRSCS